MGESNSLSEKIGEKLSLNLGIVGANIRDIFREMCFIWWAESDCR